jgi:hypothetical protein
LYCGRIAGLDVAQQQELVGQQQQQQQQQHLRSSGKSP